MAEQNQEFLPVALPQEFVGLDPEKEESIHEFLESLRDQYEACLEPILVNPEQVDARVRLFESKLHEVNKKRAEKFGRTYNPPKVLYLDRVAATAKKHKIDKALKKAGLDVLGGFDASAARYFFIGNFVLVYVNNFDDNDVDAYDTAKHLRHELSHAGSVSKLRLSPNEHGGSAVNNHRIGAQIKSHGNENMVGQIVDEGHHIIEDLIFDGRYEVFRAADPFISELPLADELVPGGREKYNALYQQLLTDNAVDPSRMLTHYYRKNKKSHYIGTSKHDEDFSRLMEKVYAGDPNFFIAGAEFVYGDKALNFAKYVKKIYGAEFFHKLMQLQDPEETIAFPPAQLS